MIRYDRIKPLRKSKGLTLKDVASRLDVSEATAQRYESGKIKNVPYNHILSYARMLSCTPQYIMGWESGDDLSLTDEERFLVLAYRSATEGRRDSVRALLEINAEGK